MEFVEYWQKRQEQVVRERVAAVVQSAVKQFNAGDRLPFYVLEQAAGVEVICTELQELRRRLFEVCNGVSD